MPVRLVHHRAVRQGGQPQGLVVISITHFVPPVRPIRHLQQRRWFVLHCEDHSGVDRRTISRAASRRRARCPFPPHHVSATIEVGCCLLLCKLTARRGPLSRAACCGRCCS